MVLSYFRAHEVTSRFVSVVGSELLEGAVHTMTPPS